jgi:hypothetical protein
MDRYLALLTIRLCTTNGDGGATSDGAMHYTSMISHLLGDYRDGLQRTYGQAGTVLPKDSPPISKKGGVQSHSGVALIADKPP